MLFKIFCGIFFTLFFSASALFSQSPSIVWDRTYGSMGREVCDDIVRISSHSFLLLGPSETNSGGNKSSNGKGNNDFWLVKINQNGDKIWDKTYGCGNADQGIEIHMSQDGNILMFGTSRSGICADKSENNRGELDYWIIKVDTNGNKIWDRTFGGNRSDVSSALAEDKNGNLYLFGNSNSDIGGDRTVPFVGDVNNFSDWIVKLDKDGNKIWDTSGNNHSYSMLATPKNLMVLVENEQFSYLYYLSVDSVSTRVTCMDLDGNKRWNKTFGGNIADYPQMIYSNDQYLYIGIESSSGIGRDKLTDHCGLRDTNAIWGNTDYWIITLDFDGNKVDDKNFGGDTDFTGDAVSSCIIDSHTEMWGGTSTSGIGCDKTDSCRGESDIWLISLNPDKSIRWQKTIGGSLADGLCGIYDLGNRQYLLYGYSDSPIGGEKTDSLYDARGWGGDMWVLKLDASEPLALDDLELKGQFRSIQKSVYLEWKDTQPDLIPEYTLLKLKDKRKNIWDTLLQNTNKRSYIDFKPQKGRNYYRVSRSNGTDKSQILEIKADWIAEKSINLYPNPNHGTFKLTFNEITEGEEMLIQLFDGTGRLIFQELKNSSPGKNEWDFSIGNLSSGIYSLNLVHGIGREALKMVVE